MNVNDSRLRVPQGRPDGGQYAAGPAAAAVRLPGLAAVPPAADLLDAGVGAGLAALLPAPSRRRVLEWAQAARPDERAQAGRRAALNLHAVRDARHRGRLTPERADELEAEARTEWIAARRGLRDAQALVNTRAQACPDQPFPRELLDRLALQVADLAGAHRRLLRARTDRIALAAAPVDQVRPWQREAVDQASRRVTYPEYRGAMHADAWQAPEP